MKSEALFELFAYLTTCTAPKAVMTAFLEITGEERQIYQRLMPKSYPPNQWDDAKIVIGKI
jgi:hypothetical protein